ncbi:beta-ketoacyl-ACP synthase [Rhodoferax sp.]|uniref:beta-ketoacyl-ACP synthase n=1 Tax=Rhodoferax sp. TaxID=50421 RepID=UPI002ACDE38E|nr:beta-ketoacyl-ACP synthase [Rhodoferax sp.]MDZ7918803.1 beta-ketoacyl-ACP synthase [Rhodoferax sp.]
MSSSALYLNAMGMVSALGADKESSRATLWADACGGVAPGGGWPADRSLHLGAVLGPLPDLDVLPTSQRSRNNALMLIALSQIRQEVDAALSTCGANRMAVILGTSTSGISESEAAMAQHHASGALPETFDLAQQEIGSPAEALAGLLGVTGPAYVVSTACSSSAKAFASAARLLRAGVCDAAIVGGVDSLCQFTIAGFSALESISVSRCNPMSANRNGINIGEGAALFLVTRKPGPVRLAGWGEASDAHHISAPDPSGKGAVAAMREALQRAQLQAAEVNYLNMHGTATLQNDAMESKAIWELFGDHVPVSSTKPLTGHALGAAGAIEAAICWLSLVDNPTGLLPPHWWDGAVDASLPAISLVKPGQLRGQALDYVMSNSFAFGGSNASLVFGRVASAAQDADSSLNAAGIAPVESLVPHSGSMSLLTRVVQADAQGLQAEVHIHAEDLFCVDGVVGGWVGLEYMAQAIAAWAGWHARQRGESPRIGFLLGCRKYTSQRSAFLPGELLHVRVQVQFQADNGLGQFDCQIEIADELVATGALTVFEPPNANEFLQETNLG